VHVGIYIYNIYYTGIYYIVAYYINNNNNNSNDNNSIIYVTRRSRWAAHRARKIVFSRYNITQYIIILLYSVLVCVCLYFVLTCVCVGVCVYGATSPNRVPFKRYCGRKIFVCGISLVSHARKALCSIRLSLPAAHYSIYYYNYYYYWYLFFIFVKTSKHDKSARWTAETACVKVHIYLLARIISGRVLCAVV